MTAKARLRTFKPGGAGFYADLQWSPDSKRVAYTDNAQALYSLDLATGVAKKIAAAKVYGPISFLSFGWSPDSRWIAYTVNTQPLAMTLVSVFGRAGQVVPDHRRPGRSRRAGVRPEREVSLPVRLDQRRPAARLVCAIDDRQPAHAQRVSRRAAERRPVPAGAESDEEKPRPDPEPSRAMRRQTPRNPMRKRRRRCGSISRASSTASSICPSPPGICRASRPATRITSTTCAPMGMPPPGDRAGRGRG